MPPAPDDLPGQLQMLTLDAAAQIGRDPAAAGYVWYASPRFHERLAAHLDMGAGFPNASHVAEILGVPYIVDHAARTCAITLEPPAEARTLLGHLPRVLQLED
jgi:hypothetical protein